MVKLNSLKWLDPNLGGGEEQTLGFVEGGRHKPDLLASS